MARIVNGRIDPSARPGLQHAQPVLRKTAAVALIIGMYTSLHDTGGFAPVGDGLAPVAGSYFVDRLAAPLVLLGAFVGQWQVAAYNSPHPVVLPWLSAETGLVYQRADHWAWAAAEAALLAVARYAFANRGLGFVLLALVFGGLWLLGWQVTPVSRRRELWDVVKGFLVLELFYEARRLVRR